MADEQLSPAASPTAPVSAGNTLWPLGDHLGTLRDLADFTGSAFTITNHRVFDTFGRLTSETNSSVDTHFAFTGKFFDDLGDTEPLTSLSHHWNRWYDPQLGKWLSEDPIGFAGGDVNLGRYVGNHATGAVDWSGLYQDGGTYTLQRPSSLPEEAVLTVQDDIIGIGMPIPDGVEGTPTKIAYRDSDFSRGAFGATGYLEDFDKRWEGVRGVEAFGVFNPFGHYSVFRALGNALLAPLEAPAIITQEVRKKVVEELSCETNPLKYWAWQAAGNMTVPANMFLDIGLVGLDNSIHTTASIGRKFGVIEDPASLPRRAVPTSSIPNGISNVPGADFVPSQSVSTPYRRPSGAGPTAAQRASVQGKPCVECGKVTPKQIADHIEPLSVQHYRDGAVDVAKQPKVEAVQPHCPDCSAKQGGFLSAFSKRMRALFGG